MGGGREGTSKRDTTVLGLQLEGGREGTSKRDTTVSSGLQLEGGEKGLVRETPLSQGYSGRGERRD